MPTVEEIVRELKIALKKDDATLRKEVERIVKKYGKRKKKKGDFEIKAGYAYFVNEKSSKYARKIFQQILDRGFEGLYISRENPENLEFSDYDNAIIYWLTSVKGEGRVNPGDLPKIQTIISSFITKHPKGVVVIEGTETMITNTEFLKVLRFLQRIRDVVSENHGILIVSMDLDTLSTKEKALLKKEIINEIPIRKSS